MTKKLFCNCDIKCSQRESAEMCCLCTLWNRDQTVRFKWCFNLMVFQGRQTTCSHTGGLSLSLSPSPLVKAVVQLVFIPPWLILSMSAGYFRHWHRQWTVERERERHRGRQRERGSGMNDRQVSEGDLRSNWVIVACCNSPGRSTRTLECMWEVCVRVCACLSVCASIGPVLETF